METTICAGEQRFLAGRFESQKLFRSKLEMVERNVSKPLGPEINDTGMVSVAYLPFYLAKCAEPRGSPLWAWVQPFAFTVCVFKVHE